MFGGGGDLRKTQMVQNKTQFYSGNGTGRDGYIYGDNGGLVPMAHPTKIEDLGTFYYNKERHVFTMPSIHSKGVNYVNNGGGRDTYISDSAGGLRSTYAPAAFKRTFYNNLRQYPAEAGWKPNRSSTASMRQKKDIFTRSQQHFNPKFNQEIELVKNYQKNMDLRLSQPKQIHQTETGKILRCSAVRTSRNDHQENYYSSADQQEKQNIEYLAKYSK